MSSVKSMTEGNELKLILGFGFPLLFGNILQQLYNFVDTVVVGRGISTQALAAVGVTGSINFLVLGFIMGMAQGVTILVSQYFGAQDMKNLKKSVTMSFLINYATGLILTILSLCCSRWILELINTPADIIDMADTYIRLIFWGILISLSYNFLSGILRALGDSRNPLIAMIIAFLVNTVLDVLFVITFKMGVAGAAYATVTAQGVSALYCLWCCSRIDVLKLSREDWKLDKELLQRSFTLSLPVAIMNSITAVGVMILQAAINGFGSLYVAGYSAASKIIIILEQISSTFGYAGGTFAGQNLGAGKIDRIRTGIRKLNLAVIVMNVSAAACMLLFGKWILSLMVGSSEPEVLSIAHHSLCFLSVFLAALGILWVYRCALQSMSDTFYPMLSGILEFTARTVVILILPGLIGYDGTLAAEVSAWISAAIMLAAVYFRRMKKLSSSYCDGKNIIIDSAS